MTAATPIGDVDTSAGLLRLGNRFCDAAALLTAVRLEVFTTLHERPASAGELRERLGLHGRGLDDYLRLLVALGVLRKTGDRYANTPATDRYLVTGSADDIGGFLRGAYLNLYPVYAGLAEALRTGKPQATGDFESMLDDPVAVGHFVRMMDGLTQGLWEEFRQAVDWTGRGSVLDFGGCRGSLVAHLVGHTPGLRGAVFDRPQIEPFFAEVAAEAGVTDRVTFHPGNFFRDPLPTADVVIFGHILHDWNPEERALLLRKAYDAVTPGGVLVIYDRMLTAERDNVENLMASLNMLLVTDGGGEYTVEEIGAQARAAGFTSITDRRFGAFDILLTCGRD
ncbi:methyltransferase [Actinoplanes siamensis]|uniref:O-methyltransferase n=1 Tax=Actinoplanes siamensis TaxID=1223317 RepID=A0A919TMI3_9ACTN|nr:methyltransferase [Actinoplanes siamensis]GIF07090.1 O-methyltransferase [Actinoplanes siamensis]